MNGGSGAVESSAAAVNTRALSVEAPRSVPTPTSSPVKTDGEDVADLPPLYHFPPFFTRQPNSETLSGQLGSWGSLILEWCRRRRVFVVSATAEECGKVPFRNTAIDRALKPAFLREILEGMCSRGEAEWLDGGEKKKGSGRGAGSAAGQDRCLMLWRTADAWADMLDKHIDESGAQGQVLTLYELTDGSRGSSANELKDLDPLILRRAIEVLAKRGKAHLMRGPDGEDSGVKFY
ncbi:hypothetical protein PYCC9005_005941 [Savitreella phatthalungensis]